MTIRRNETGPYEPSGFFVLRTPLLPMSEWLAWSDGLQAGAAVGESSRLAQIYEQDCAELRDRLRAIIRRPEVEEALFLASPGVGDCLHVWATEPTSDTARKLEPALVRYFSRMTGRCTPFGLFAGWSTGALGHETCLALEGRAKYVRHSRLAADYLDRLIAVFANDVALRPDVVYRPNDSLYRAAARLHYIRVRDEPRERGYDLVALDDSAYLTDTIARAVGGASAESLASALVTSDVSIVEAREYVSQLIDRQLLVPDLALSITGPEPLTVLPDRLRARGAAGPAADTLVRARAALEAIDEAGLGSPRQRYQAIASELEQLPVPVEVSRLFHVDLMKPAPDAVLGRAVLAELGHGAEIVRRLSMPSDEQRSLQEFVQRFVDRYAGMEVPLAEALDDEVGIGFDAEDDTSPLLGDLAFPPRLRTPAASANHALLVRTLTDALHRGAQEIRLTADEVRALGDEAAPPLPDAFAVTARLAGASRAAIDRGDFRLLIEGVVGPSGVELFGRLCHLDRLLHEHVRSHLRAEEAHRPEAILAEIVHLPEPRAGNIILRPVLRDTKSPTSGVQAQRTIGRFRIRDLLVSVRGDRVRLRSARLNREIIPRLTTAHNYAWRTLGVYKFLCTLAQQGVAVWPGWRWGALSAAPFLPRVATGRLVLSLAQWRASGDDVRDLCERKGADRYRAIQQWRRARMIPRLVGVVDRGNVLPVDFDNALSADAFADLCKRRGGVTLVELFPPADQLCVESREGSFTHELVVPFVKRRDAVREPERHAASRPAAQFQRRFLPGSKWLFVKLHTGPATVDTILREFVRPLTQSLQRAAAIERWFFVRYDDPSWHLRLRFEGRPKTLQADVIPAVNAVAAALLAKGAIWRVQFDTYDREVERYGGEEGVTCAERLFHLDSEAVLDMLDALAAGHEGARQRWRLAVLGIDRLLADFGFSVDAKHAVLEQLRSSFAGFCGADRNVSRQLGEKFRQERKPLEALLAGEEHEDAAIVRGAAALDRRSARLAPVIAALKRHEKKGRLAVSLRELLPEYIHMHTNRLLRTAHVKQEFAIYDLMSRHFESQRMRARDASQGAAPK